MEINLSTDHLSQHLSADAHLWKTLPINNTMSGFNHLVCNLGTILLGTQHWC